MTLELDWGKMFGLPAPQNGTTTMTRRKKQTWTSCPRCIGGNMYLESNGEHVCIQCGCRKTSVVASTSKAF